MSPVDLSSNDSRYKGWWIRHKHANLEIIHTLKKVDYEVKYTSLCMATVKMDNQEDPTLIINGTELFTYTYLQENIFFLILSQRTLRVMLPLRPQKLYHDLCILKML